MGVNAFMSVKFELSRLSLQKLQVLAFTCHLERCPSLTEWYVEDECTQEKKLFIAVCTAYHV